jgi:hypothetical protein
MSRQAKKAPPVFTYEELAASPSMSGLVSFLNLPTREDVPGAHQFHPQVDSPLGVDLNQAPQVVINNPARDVLPLGAEQIPPQADTPLGAELRLETHITADTTENPPDSPLGAQSLAPKGVPPLELNLGPEKQPAPNSGSTAQDTPLGVESLHPKGDSVATRNEPTGPAQRESPCTPRGATPLSRSLGSHPGQSSSAPRGLTPPPATTSSVESLPPIEPSAGYTPRVTTLTRTPKLSPKQISAQWVSLSTGVIYDVSRVSRVDIAQQSMALGEERFYETIWRCAGSYTFHIIGESKHIHTFRAGVLALSKIARLNIKTIKDLLPKLIEKKILTVIADGDVRTNLGKTYEIYSYEEILRRQEGSGLTFVIKNGRAVEFVQPGSALGGVTPLVIQRGTAPRGETPHRQEHPQRLGVMPLYRPRGDTTPHIDTQSNTRQTTTAVRSLLQTQLPTFDDLAVEHLWTDCRRRVPDVTPDEVRCLFSAKLPQSFARGIENRNGFLLRVVAVSCTPAAIAELRQSRELEQTDLTGGAGNYLISSADEIVRLGEMLDAMPNHPQAAEWQKTIDSLREQN